LIFYRFVTFRGNRTDRTGIFSSARPEPMGKESQQREKASLTVTPVRRND
jgi:hypothetical protein